jgi:uncharacterized protein
MQGPVSFIELGVPNGAKARDFFGRLLDWPAQDRGSDNYLFETSPVQVGLHPNDPRASMIVYFAVPDLDAAVARVRSLGGQAGDPGADEEGFGRFVECRDDQGVVFGLRQASVRPRS